jgi:flagellar motor component MotA
MVNDETKITHEILTDKLHFRFVDGVYIKNTFIIYITDLGKFLVKTNAQNFKAAIDTIGELFSAYEEYSGYELAE